MFYRAVWVPGKGRDLRSLGTRDRNEADRLGRQLLAALLRNEGGAPRTALTLGDLWERFERDAPEYADNHPRTKHDAKARVEILLAFFGPRRQVESLSAADQHAYCSARRAGGIKLKDGSSTHAVRARSVEADVVVLRSMLRWATTMRGAGDQPLLDRNPLQGVAIQREKNPRRPVATWERFEGTRQMLRQLQAEAVGKGLMLRWRKVELALVIAEATGRRLGSIRQLKWSDVDFDAMTIRWRAETDKKGFEGVMPMPAKFAEELRTYQARMGAIGGWVFPAERDASQAMGRDQFDKFLRLAQQQAGLGPQHGSLWHAYRRKWATERKHLPLKDVAAAGGWRSVETLLRCYQQPDQQTLLSVISEERKVRELSRSTGRGETALQTAPRAQRQTSELA